MSMKLFATCALVCFSWFSLSEARSQTILCSWNIRDFGLSKDDKEILFIARTLKDYDIIAIQEVVAGNGGAQAVARLAEQLNRMGSKWDYVVSDQTSGESSYKKERYAFIWKSTRVRRIKDPWLDQNYEKEIDREPFFMTFEVQGIELTLVNFHAITKARNPETEVKYFKHFVSKYPSANLIFCGDFNLPESHSVFNPLKDMGFRPAFEGQKTSLRQKCVVNDCLASEFDNVFYHNTTLKVISRAVNHFYASFASMEEALKISDHIPIVVEFTLTRPATEITAD